MKEKTYFKILSLIILLFIGFNFVTWNLITKKFFIYEKNIDVGDLGRMSFLSKSLTLKKNEQNLPNKHIQYKDNIEIDVLTIGDSFSNGSGVGRDQYYQDNIATAQNLKVMNIQPSDKGYIETILILSSNGILDKLNPKSIILQVVESGVIDNYAKVVNWNIGLENNSTSFLDKKYKYSRSKTKPFFINNLNYTALLYPILYKYDDNAVYSKTYIAPLTKNLFSSEDKSSLLFYYRDLEKLSKSSNKSVSLLNDNLNKLQKILSEKNIKLYFMPSVDKYNLYSKYIQNNQYQKSTFFEMLRQLKKEYTFIDTKMILEKMLDDNIYDVYHSDDTHWSIKASEEIFKQVKLR